MSNQLATESSPYLLQHAENPVDWYPWGDQALAVAERHDRPILLSIGYSSCHWCHVMAHESFEDASTAAYMNQHFVNIKVDREERPDIDAIYMDAAQSMTGHGGWPLTAFLTPDQLPFFVGTYFPPVPRVGVPSFIQVMESITEAWRTQRDQIEQTREQVITTLSATARLSAPADPITSDVVIHARSAAIAAHDQAFGGFGGAPKFPAASLLDFLLARPDRRSREVALDTLRKMAAGGIYDQIGGGFSRYSVDERWHIPHFEKMLYDNALLARNYLHAYQLTGEDWFAQICRETLDWIMRELRGDDGGFASSLDADSVDEHGSLEEGAFYAWDIDELRELAGSHADDICAYWGVIDHGEFDGKNVLFVSAPERRPAGPVFNEIRSALYARRARRGWPAVDQKRVTAWNALAIAALAEAGVALGEARYVDAATVAGEFIESHLRTGDGRLRRSSMDGRPGPAGYLEDHACVVAAYLTLYEATFDERWFVAARETADLMITHFADDAGGFFTTASDHERLLVRRKDLGDSPTPSGNSTAALALLRLHAFTGEDRYRRRAADSIRMMQAMAARFATTFGHTLQAIDFYLAEVREIALVGSDIGALRDAIVSAFRPHIVVAGRVDAMTTAVPLLRERGPLDGRAVAYVCKRMSCELPTDDPRELLDQLGSTGLGVADQ